jgi:hypothetical protein
MKGFLPTLSETLLIKYSAVKTGISPFASANLKPNFTPLKF